jgi:glycosyltransferase involved in cell wall biosynthesis
MKKIVILVTVPVVLETWLRGQAKFLSKYYKVEIITSHAESIENIEKFENVLIKTVDFTRKINVFKDLKVLVQLYIYFIINRPFIVYTLTPKAGLLGMIAAFIARVPKRVHNVVGLPHIEAKGKRKFILISTEKLTYFFSTALYCNSFNLINEIKRLTTKKVHIIGQGSANGVDTNYFADTLSRKEKLEIRFENKIKEDDFVLTFVGRIVQDKGINELLNVFIKLKKKYLSLKLLLVGDYKNELDKVSLRSKNLMDGDEDIIHIQFQEDIRKFLAISDLFILPSYREGLPNALIEAGSYGIPLVATNINGCNEIIKHAENGALINTKDEVSLYDEVEKFILDKVYYYSIKSNVRKSIVDRYSQEYFYAELRKEFLKIEKGLHDN